jgi:hypothetical protein
MDILYNDNDDTDNEDTDNIKLSVITNLANLSMYGINSNSSLSDYTFTYTLTPNSTKQTYFINIFERHILKLSLHYELMNYICNKINDKININQKKIIYVSNYYYTLINFIVSQKVINNIITDLYEIKKEILNNMFIINRKINYFKLLQMIYI